MIMSAMSILTLVKTVGELIATSTPRPNTPIGKELVLAKELQSKVAHLMWNDQSKGIFTMIRFLKSRHQNVTEAEKMIREHIEWRKKMRIDNLRMEAPNPKLWKQFWYNITGFARNDYPVMIIPFGEWKTQSFLDAGGSRQQFEIHQSQMLEKALASVEYVEEHKNNNMRPAQYFMICDMNGFSYKQLSNYESLQLISSVVHNLRDNYPGLVFYCYVINADWIFKILHQILQPLASDSIQRLKVYGKERRKWERVIRKQIDPVVLPYQYGGYSKKEILKRKVLSISSA